MVKRTLLQSPDCQILIAGSRSDYAYVDADEPATRVMTDFRTGPMITTPRSTSIELALQPIGLQRRRRSRCWPDCRFKRQSLWRDIFRWHLR